MLSILLAMVLFFAFSLVFSSASRTDAVSLMTGMNGLLWWAGAVGMGIIVPMMLVMRERALEARQACFLFSCILVGGFLLRTVLVLAGQ
jgi:formate-dependent nitrite reductase membrane component NrfD